MFLDFGVDPRAMDTMSIYEIISMQQAHGKRGKPVEVTPEEFADITERLREISKSDPSVVI